MPGRLIEKMRVLLADEVFRRLVLSILSSLRLMCVCEIRCISLDQLTMFIQADTTKALSTDPNYKYFPWEIMKNKSIQWSSTDQ